MERSHSEYLTFSSEKMRTMKRTVQKKELMHNTRLLVRCILMPSNPQLSLLRFHFYLLRSSAAPLGLKLSAY